MPVLEPVIATLLANTSEFTASLSEAKGSMEAFAAESTAAGEVAGAGLGDGLATGAKSVEKDVEKAGKHSGGIFISGLNSALGSFTGLTGVSIGPLEKALHRAHAESGKLESGSKSLTDRLTRLGRIATIGTAAGLAAASAEGYHLAMQMQSSTTAISVAADTSVSAAKQITDSFSATAGSSEFSANAMAAAFAKVAGQLKSAEGAALDRQQATEFMSASDDLAQAKQISLAEATKAVAGAMQAFHTPTARASALTDTLLNVSNATGQSIKSTASQLERIKTRLGALTPPLSDVGGLLLDLTNHGITGRQAMTVLTSGFQNFLKPTETLVKAHRDLKIAFGDLPVSLRGLAKEYETGNIKASDVSKQTKNLTIAQTTLWSAFKKGADATRTAYQAQEKLGITTVDAHGNLLPMTKIVGQLHDKVEGLGNAQAIATLKAMGFGSNAAKLLPIVRAGAVVFNQNAEAASKAGAAHAAAEKQAQTLSVQFKVLKASVEDLLEKLGAALIPIFDKVGVAFAKVIEWVIKCKPLLYTLAAIFGTVLVAAIGAYIAHLAVAAVDSVKAFGKMIAAGWTWVAEHAAQVGEWIVSNAVVIGGWVAQAAAATAAFIAENLATLGIIAGIALLVGAVIWLATHWKQTWNFVKRMAEDVWHFLDGIWHAIVDGVKEAFEWIKNHLSTIIPVIIAIITGPIGIAVLLIVKYWKQIKETAITVWNDLLDFIKKVPGKILSFFEGVGTWLLHIGSDLLTGLWNGIVAGAQAVWSWLQQLPSAIWSLLSGAAMWLFKTGLHIIEGLWHGLENAAVDVWNWIKNIPTNLLHNLEGAATWLFDIGKKIISGLWNGLKHAWHDVTGWLGSIGGWITNLKGPPAKDAVLLHENGRLIMQGLGEGLKHGWSKHVAPVLGDMTTALSGGLSAHVGVSGGGVGRISATSAQQTTILQVTTPIQINGQTLAQTVTQYQLRGARVTGNALGRYSGGSQTAAATGINANAVAR